MTRLADTGTYGSLWERTRFSSRQEPQLVDDGLHDLLAPLYLGYGPRAVGRGGKASGLTSPSAGALYPLEVYCRIPGDDDVALYDPETRTLRRPAGPPGVVPRLLAVDGHQSVATLALALRPWASIRKYGLRGYFYSHLDGAHALASIVRAAEALGRPVGVWLPPEDRELPEGREVYAIVSLGSARVPAAASVPPARDTGRARQAGESIETMMWDRLRAYGAGAPWPSAHDSATFALLAGGDVAGGPARPWDAQAWTRRRSAHGFDQGAGLSMSALTELIEGLPQDFPGNLSQAAARPQVRVVEPASANRAGTLWELDRGKLRPAGSCQMAGEDLVAACAKQAVVEHASALVVFVVGQGQLQAMSDVTAALLCSGVLSAQLYLACAGHGYGCTCIGAYDSAEFRRHQVIGEGEDVVNITAIGLAGHERAEKVDRTQFALRSGEATW